MTQKISIGIDIGGTSVKSGIVTLKEGRLEIQAFKTIDVKHKNIKNLLEVVFSSIEENLRIVKSEGPLYLGISTSGTLDCNEVVIDAHFYEGYNGTSWRKVIENKLPNRFTDISTLNDGNAAAWAEYSVREDIRVRDAVHLAVGTGVAGGIISGGQLLTGARCAAGEVGHIIVVSQGRLCPCGKLGCVEAYAGSGGILENAKEWQKKNGTVLKEYSPTDFRQLLDQAKRGDKAAIEALKEAGRYLGVAIASLLNVLNPGLVTLGGGVVEGTLEAFTVPGSNPFLTELQTTVQDTAQSTNYEGVKIAPGKFGNQASIIGAASYVMHKSRA